MFTLTGMANPGRDGSGCCGVPFVTWRYLASKRLSSPMRLTA